MSSEFSALNALLAPQPTYPTFDPKELENARKENAQRQSISPSTLVEEALSTNTNDKKLFDFEVVPLESSNSPTEEVVQSNRGGWFSWWESSSVDPGQKELDFSKSKIIEKVKLLPQSESFDEELQAPQMQRLNHYSEKFIEALDNKYIDLSFKDKLQAFEKERTTFLSDPNLNKAHPRGKSHASISLKSPARTSLEKALITSMKAKYQTEGSEVLSGVEEGAKSINNTLQSHLPEATYTHILITKIFGEHSTIETDLVSLKTHPPSFDENAPPEIIDQLKERHQNQINTLQEVLESVINPHESHMKEVLSKIIFSQFQQLKQKNKIENAIRVWQEMLGGTLPPQKKYLQCHYSKLITLLHTPSKQLNSKTPLQVLTDEYPARTESEKVKLFLKQHIEFLNLQATK